VAQTLSPDQDNQVLPTVSHVPRQERRPSGALLWGPASAGGIPGYEILEELGKGGMGVVYLARQVSLNRLVALKMILSGRRVSGAELRRFRTEAEAVARLQHPGIIQVYEFGEWQGQPWFALEYCAGGTLAGKVGESGLLPNDAVRLVESIARAVLAAHEAGFIHRDLKPGNILLAAEGTPKVADFGLARVLGPTTVSEGELPLSLVGADRTVTGSIMGTPAYMAPEQAAGRVRDICPATDVWALGVILYELLTGTRPFSASSTIELRQQILHQPVQAPSKVREGIPADLDVICQRCLEKEPSRRYPTACDLAEDLSRFLQDEPLSHISPRSPAWWVWWARRNGYDTLEEIARGGMAVVFRARHLGLNRVVALKMILTGEHAGHDVLARFQCEAEAVARLTHPNIVQIYEIDQHQGLHFISLEYCSAGSLDRHLKGTPIDPALAAHLVSTLARAMQHAHERGVLHRDLKPANVLLAEASGGRQAPVEAATGGSRPPLADLVPKITNPGLVRTLGELTQTRPGMPLGTPSYLAPEQAEGKDLEVGPATDVYALGAILYECLTGRPPFRAATVLDTLHQVIHEEPVPPRQLNANVPRDLEAIILKCLQKQPGHRYARASALADDLRCFLEGRPILARPVSRLGGLGRWARREPGVATLLAAGLFMLLAGIAITSIRAIRAEKAAGEARETLKAREEAYRYEQEVTKRFLAFLKVNPHLLPLPPKELLTRFEKENPDLDPKVIRRTRVVDSFRDLASPP
jgi:serine/threonine protein kinase